MARNGCEKKFKDMNNFGPVVYGMPLELVGDFCYLDYYTMLALDLDLLCIPDCRPFK